MAEKREQDKEVTPSTHQHTEGITPSTTSMITRSRASQQGMQQHHYLMHIANTPVMVTTNQAQPNYGAPRHLDQKHTLVLPAAAGQGRQNPRKQNSKQGRREYRHVDSVF